MDLYSPVQESYSSWSPDAADERIESGDPESIARTLIEIDKRIKSGEHDVDDMATLESFSSEEYEGLEQYSDDLMSQAELVDAMPDVSQFEQYRNPAEYLQTLGSDMASLVRRSGYGDRGIELFHDSRENVREKAQIKAFRVLKTNVGREMALNFMKYQPIGPMWDWAGACYGAYLGARMELEDVDVRERLQEVKDELEP